MYSLIAYSAAAPAAADPRARQVRARTMIESANLGDLVRYARGFTRPRGEHVFAVLYRGSFTAPAAAPLAFVAFGTVAKDDAADHLANAAEFFGMAEGTY